MQHPPRNLYGKKYTPRRETSLEGKITCLDKIDDKRSKSFRRVMKGLV